MPGQLKDYYKILEVSADVDATAIKRAYRKQAFKYHPDTNRDNKFAAQHFRKIQEAYHVLGNSFSRKKYDYDRWLTSMNTRAAEQEVITPQWILNESVKLNIYMGTIDTYRMSHRSLNSYLMQLLSDSNMAVLKADSEPSVNESIIKLLLKATDGLKIKYMVPIGEKLMELTDNEHVIIRLIRVTIARRKRQAFWAKWQPLILILISLLLVGCMYLWGRLH